MRTVGAVVRGIRTPIIREGDDLPKIVCDSVLAAAEAERFSFHDRDVVAVTESVVARAAGEGTAHIIVAVQPVEGGDLIIKGGVSPVADAPAAQKILISRSPHPHLKDKKLRLLAL